MCRLRGTTQATAVVLGRAVHLSAYAPHLATRMLGLVTVGPTEQLFPGVPNELPWC